MWCSLVVALVVGFCDASITWSQYIGHDCPGSSIYDLTIDANPIDWFVCLGINFIPPTTHFKVYCEDDVLRMGVYTDAMCSTPSYSPLSYTQENAGKLFSGACANASPDPTPLSTRLTPTPTGPVPTCPLTTTGSNQGDPITYFGDRRVEYKLPTDEPHLLIGVRNLDVFGTTSPGWSTDQWIKKVILSTKSGEKLMDLRIKQDLVNFNRSQLLPNAFETLDVVMWPSTRPTPVEQCPPADGYFYHDDEITITFVQNKVARVAGAPRRECAVVSGPYMKLVICSTSAHEWFGNGGGAYKYAHLDMEIMDLDKRHGRITGVLPELWGISPRSETSSNVTILSDSGPGGNDVVEVWKVKAT